MVTLFGETNIEILQGESFTDPGAFSDGDEEIIVTWQVDANNIKVWNVIYSATDEYGKTGTAIRYVTIKASETTQDPEVACVCPDPTRDPTSDPSIEPSVHPTEEIGIFYKVL